MTTKRNRNTLKSLLKTLKHYKVESYKEGELEIKFSPMAFVEPRQPITKDSVEDDLFYSASINKLSGMNNAKVVEKRK